LGFAGVLQLGLFGFVLNVEGACADGRPGYTLFVFFLVGAIDAETAALEGIPNSGHCLVGLVGLALAFRPAKAVTEVQAAADVFRAVIVDDVFIGEGAGFKVEIAAHRRDYCAL
jgi:hypothetical protein